jgi:hypothetical protein
MIDFDKEPVLKLTPGDLQDIAPSVAPIIVPGETVIFCFEHLKAIRDRVVVTNKRLIVVDVQGLTGKRRVFMSLPFSKIRMFSIETGTADSKLDLWFNEGKIRLEFKGKVDIHQISHLIASHIL